MYNKKKVLLISDVLYLCQIPGLIDQMTAVPGTSLRSQQLAGDQLTNILKKSWDPVYGTYSQIKLVAQKINDTDMFFNAKPMLRLIGKHVCLII